MTIQRGRHGAYTIQPTRGRTAKAGEVSAMQETGNNHTVPFASGGCCSIRDWLALAVELLARPAVAGGLLCVCLACHAGAGHAEKTPVAAPPVMESPETTSPVDRAWTAIAELHEVRLIQATQEFNQ